MANFGKALQGLSQGLRSMRERKSQERQLDLMERELEDKEKRAKIEQEERIRAQKAAEEQAKIETQLNILKEQVNIKKVENENQKILNNQMQGASDAFSALYAGRDDITPNQRDSAIKQFKEKYNTDISLWFKANFDDDGVIKSYSADTAESLQKEVQNKIDMTNVDANKINSAAAMLNAETNKMKFEKGEDPANVQEWLIQNLKNDKDFQSKSQSEQRQDMLVYMQAMGSGQGLDIKFGKDGQIESIQLGKKSLTQDVMQKPTTAAVEKSLVNYIDQMATVRKIKDAAFPETLTWPGQIKTVTLRTLDKLSTEDLNPQQKEWLGKAYVFKAELGKFFDQYRVAVTGAQAGMQELKYLESRILNTHMSKAEFEYVINDTIATLNKNIRIKRQLMSSGLSGDDLMNALNDIIISGTDPTLTNINITNRGEELEKLFRKSNPSATEDEVMTFVTDELQMEGYVE